MNSYHRRKTGIGYANTRFIASVRPEVDGLKKESLIDRHSSHTLKSSNALRNSIDAVWLEFWQPQTDLVRRKNSPIEVPVFSALSASVKSIRDAESDVLNGGREGRLDFATDSATERIAVVAGFGLRSSWRRKSKEGGRGSIIGGDGRSLNPISDTENFQQMRSRSWDAGLV